MTRHSSNAADTPSPPPPARALEFDDFVVRGSHQTFRGLTGITPRMADELFHRFGMFYPTGGPKSKCTADDLKEFQTLGFIFMRVAEVLTEEAFAFRFLF